MIKRKNLKKGICSFLLLSLTVLCIPLQTEAATKEYDAINRVLDCNKEKPDAYMPGIHSEYQIDLKHSTSAFVKGYRKATSSNTSNPDLYRVTNTEKDTSKFAVYRKGARSLKKDENGKYTYLDVKVYYWVKPRVSGQDYTSNKPDAYYCGFGNGDYKSSLNTGGECGRVTIQKKGRNDNESECMDLYQEYHFYKAGTIGKDGEKEIRNVSCVSCFTDIDSYEDWIVKQDDVIADYATSKKATPNYVCLPGGKDGKDYTANDNYKTHITKESVGLYYVYSGKHRMELKKGECATEDNHKVWLEWRTNGTDGIVFGYRAHNRASEVSYDAKELYRTLTFTHYVNGKEQAEIAEDDNTTLPTGGRMSYTVSAKSPKNPEGITLTENAIGTMSRKILKYSKLTSLTHNSFYLNGEKKCGASEIKRVDSNDALRPEYKFVYTIDGKPGKNTEIDSDRTITFNWYSLYYINYHANGGIGSMNKQTFRYGVTQKTTENKFTKPNKLVCLKHTLIQIVVESPSTNRNLISMYCKDVT